MRKFHLAVRLFVLMGSVPLMLACADRLDRLIEEAKFALDQCNPAVESSLTNCQTAVDKADEIQTTDAANLDAAILESSGRLGLAGFDFLQLAARLTDLQNVATEDFAEFRSLVTDVEAENGREISLTELDASKAPLVAALAGVAATETNERAFFQLGIIQAITAFIRPVKLAGTNAGTIELIDDTVTAAVLADFLAADNNLATSGTTEDDILRPIRENYCRCSLNGTWVTDCLQDLMRCEMDPNATDNTGDNGGIEQDYDGNGDANDVDCIRLLDPPTLTACGGSDTSS